MKPVAKFLAAVMVASVSTYASAACQCSCVEGQIEPVCAAATDLPPVCAPRACTLKQPSGTLVSQSQTAANTTKQCRTSLVRSPQTGSYVSKQVCQ